MADITDSKVTASRYFVLQEEDQVFGCSILAVRFSAPDLGVLRDVLANEVSDDPDLCGTYVLDSDQVTAIATAFDVAFDAMGRTVLLEPWHAIRNTPYLCHTWFELFLLLEGRKPFAMFAGGDPSPWLDEVIAQFTPFVQAGRLSTRTVDSLISKPGESPADGSTKKSRNVVYVIPGQEWRIDAHLLLVEVGLKEGWSDALERLEGSLLGYEDWQNDWWLGRGALLWQNRDRPVRASTTVR